MLHTFLLHEAIEEQEFDDATKQQLGQVFKYMIPYP